MAVNKTNEKPCFHCAYILVRSARQILSKTSGMSDDGADTTAVVDNLIPL